MDKKLTKARIALMGLQHLFAMFGATILVPLITGLSVQVTLIGVGVGTIMFHLIQKKKGRTWAMGVPVFLGSSFAFMAGINVVTGGGNPLSDATGGILIAGIFYLVVALLIKFLGVEKVMRFMPTVVTAPTVILIGVMLAPFAISMSAHNLPLALITLIAIIIAAIWGKGLFKITPILIGIVVGTIAAVFMHFVLGIDVHGTAQAARIDRADWRAIGMPVFMLPTFNLIPILIMFPFVFATIAEHIADMVILSRQSGNDYIKEPGLARTLAGDGVATIFQGFIGSPAATTYSENVGLVTLTRVFNAWPLILAGVFAALLGFSPLVASAIYWIPEAVIGGASFILYGMIAAVGIRNLVDDKINLGDMKNCIIVAVMLVIGLGLRFGPAITIPIGEANLPIDRLGVAIAVVIGIILNLVLKSSEPEKIS
ncbi:MAG: uracil permease [Treponema sp.]|nr:uracil permease [Treponema sp.]